MFSKDDLLTGTLTDKNSLSLIKELLFPEFWVESEIYSANNWESFVLPVPEFPVNITNGFTFIDNK